MSATRLIMLIFFVQPLAFGAWLPRVPDIQARLGLGTAELGVALLGLPVGLLIAMPFIGPIVSRFGGRVTMVYGLPLFLIAISLPSASVSPIMLFGALVLCGLTMSTVELGMNVVADEVEKYGKVAIMSRCHGFWSLGMMAGSLAGAGAAQYGIAPQIAVPGVAAVAMLIGPALAFRLPKWEHSDSPAEGGSSGLFIPGWLLLGICLVALASNVLEGAAADWSALYLRQVVGADAGAAGLGYTAYALLMAAGRFGGDCVRTLWGPVVVARVCYGIAVLGLILIVTAANYPLVLVGFALAGFGGSVGVPLAVSAAASVGGRPPAANVAMVSLVSLVGFLCAPPVLGALAQVFGLSAAFSVFLLPVLAVAIFVAYTLAPSRSAGARRALAE